MMIRVSLSEPHVVCSTANFYYGWMTTTTTSEPEQVRASPMQWVVTKTQDGCVTPTSGPAPTIKPGHAHASCAKFAGKQVQKVMNPAVSGPSKVLALRMSLGIADVQLSSFLVVHDYTDCMFCIAVVTDPPRVQRLVQRASPSHLWRVGSLGNTETNSRRNQG